MENLYDRMTEDSLSALVEAGYSVDVSISGYGAKARFRVKIAKGSTYLGCTGLEVCAEGEGAEGAAALRGAVATAETFLYAVPARRPAPAAADPIVPPPLQIPQAPELDTTEARRQANLPHTAQQDEQARAMVDADREMAF